MKTAICKPKTEDVKILLSVDNICFIKSSGKSFSKFINNCIDKERKLSSVGDNNEKDFRDIP